MEVYLDNSATTMVYPEVADIVTRVMLEDYGNAASMHLKGVEAERYIHYTKEVMAKTMKVSEKEIFFTSGGTESDNWAIIGAAYANMRAGRHLITTRIEHPAVLRTMEFLTEQGFFVTYLPVNSEGGICLRDLQKAMRPDTILVSMMHVNNEVGAVQPIAAAAELVKSMNPKTLFHVDAVQGYGKLRIYPKRWNIDMVSISGHKVHGPKGIGALYINEKVKIKPITYGGGQQRGYRSGTENVSGIAGLGKAAALAYSDLDNDMEQLYELREYFIHCLMSMEGVKINGPLDREGAPHIVNASIEGIRSEVLLHALEDKGIYVSAGSACSAHKHTTSATLSAMGLEQRLLDSALRFSFSTFTTKQELDYTIEVLEETIPLLRRYTHQ